MPEILGDYETVEFSEHQKDFVNHAKNSYIAQLNVNKPIKEKVLAMYKVIDEINDDSFVNKDQPSCKKGCAHCCYIQVATMEWEIVTILEYMKERGLEFTQQELELLEKQAIIKDDKEYILSPYRRCVFLGKDNFCGIYEVRPSACRNYYVFSDPSDCNTFNDKASGRTLVNFNLDTVAPILALMELSEMKPMAQHLLQKLKEQT